MRIAIVGVNQGVIGGAETYLTWLFGALLGAGHQLAFAYEIPSVDPARAVDRGIEPLVRWDLQTLSRPAFLAELTAFEPDVVFLQGSRDEALDLELARGFRAALFAHAFYATCATGWRVHQIPQREVCSRRFGPACLPVNYFRGCGARNPVALLKLYSRQRGRSDVLQALAGTLVASEYMRDVYVQHGVPERNLRVIPYPAERAPDPVPPAPSSSPSRVLFLGRLTSGKGAARAIQVVARCQRKLGRPLHLTIAGTGPELERCKRFASKLKIETEFTGWVGQDRRLELLRAADVLIVPSMWPEPFGIVGIEAASVGLPAVAYSVGGIVDWLRPGISGELADGPDFAPAPLVEALARAFASPEHHRSLQLGAWRMAHEFSAERHLSRLVAWFEELATQK